MIEVFGSEMVFKMAAIGIVFYIVILAPVWIPGIQAYRHRNELARPFVFVCVVTCLSYGVFAFLLFLIAVPAEAYAIFIAPSLQEAGKPYGENVIKVIDFFSSYGWLLVVVLQIVLTVILTNKLIKKWNGVNASIFG